MPFLHPQPEDAPCRGDRDPLIKWSRKVLMNVDGKGEERGCIGFWWGNWREVDHWGDIGVDGWIILRWILVGKPEGRRTLGDLGADGWIILGWILVGKLEGRRTLGRPRRR